MSESEQNSDVPLALSRSRRFPKVKNDDKDTSDEEIKNFWDAELWEEDSKDSEWSFDNKKLQNDIFDSDFFLSEESDSSHEKDNIEEQLYLNQKIQKKQCFDYQKAAKQRQKISKNRQQIWSLLENPYKMKNGKTITHADLLQEALKRKNDVLSSKNDDLHQNTIMSVNPIIKNHNNTKSNPIITFHSWNPASKFPVAKKKNKEENGELEYDVSHERQLISFFETKNSQKNFEFFLNKTLTVEDQNQKFKYIDPLTKIGYNSIEEFRKIRQKINSEEKNLSQSRM